MQVHRANAPGIVARGSFPGRHDTATSNKQAVVTHPSTDSEVSCASALVLKHSSIPANPESGCTGSTVFCACPAAKLLLFARRCALNTTSTDQYVLRTNRTALGWERAQARRHQRARAPVQFAQTDSAATHGGATCPDPPQIRAHGDRRRPCARAPAAPARQRPRRQPRLPLRAPAGVHATGVTRFKPGYLLLHDSSPNTRQVPMAQGVSLQRFMLSWLPWRLHASAWPVCTC